MRALKKINNNAVICKDSAGRELIATGKGLGFGTLPRELALEEIERTFYDVDSRYGEVLRDLPPDVVDLTGQLVDIARNELPYTLSPNLVFTLSDHIAFAIERARKNINIKMPLAYDVEQNYPAEYKLGCYALQRIRRDLHIGLPPSEATGIALSLLNAKVAPDSRQEQTNTARDEEMLEDVTTLVENHFHILIERDTFNYSRYVTHMQYLFGRVHNGAALNSDNLQMYASLQSEFPEIAACAEEISAHIQAKWASELTDEEKIYLILHINRICVKEGL